MSTHTTRPRWIVYCDCPQPSYLREGHLARPPFNAFHTYGEAWEFLILRWGRNYDRVTRDLLPPPPPTTPL